MIKVCGAEVTPTFFSDNTQRIGKGSGIDIMRYCHNTLTGNLVVEWKYENDTELVTLIYLKKFIDETIRTTSRGTKDDLHVILFMPYVPNARMDRVENEYEVFTLKYFAQVINDLDFYKVLIYDAHSRVTPALLNNCIDVYDSDDILAPILADIDGYEVGKSESNILLCFPDKGAMERYSKKIKGDWSCYNVVYGEKSRDWNSGEINSDSYKLVPVTGRNIRDFKTAIVFDDIISTGNTIDLMLSRLDDYNIDHVYVYASHYIASESPNSAVEKFCKHASFVKLITTDSIYSTHNTAAKSLPDIISKRISVYPLYVGDYLK